jgi:spoIIIJ-associated protein
MIETASVDALLREFFEQMGLSLEGEIELDGSLIMVNLMGKDVRLFENGRNRRDLALLTILKLMIKQRHNVEPKIILDFNGARKQRLQNVALMAKKTAEMVRVKGIEEELPPMSPAERRAVHLELEKMSGIKTESRGVEPHRRIVILVDEEELL